MYQAVRPDICDGADAHDATPAQGAPAWLLSPPRVAVIPGASSVEQLGCNAAAADGRTRELGAAGSLPLGLGARPTLVTTRLATGDRVLLCTDGVAEARDVNGEFIDLARVLGALTGGSPDEALDRVLVNLYREAGHELTDDLALMIAEYRPTE